MIVITNNWKMWGAGMIVSLAIFLVIFFTVIKPSSDTANNAVKAGLQQSQQVINQAQSSLPKNAPASATKALSNASTLTSCLQAAGTDVSKVSACQTKYAG